MVFLAVPFPAHKDVAKMFSNWNGKIVVDTMNTLDLSLKQREELGGVLSSKVVAKAFSGARVVKGFNHLPAEKLGTNPSIQGQRQAVFLSSNDVDASATVAAVATQLGFEMCIRDSCMAARVGREREEAMVLVAGVITRH